MSGRQHLDAGHTSPRHSKVMLDAHLEVPLDKIANTEQKERLAKFLHSRPFYDRLNNTKKGLDEEQFVQFYHEVWPHPSRSLFLLLVLCFVIA